MEKIWVAWGAGETFKRYMQRNSHQKFSFIIDNNIAKDGAIYCGIPVVHPSKITEWKNYKIVILVEDAQSVAKQLEACNLQKESDYVYGDYDLPNEIPVSVMQEALMGISFHSGENEIEFEVHSRDEYELVSKRYAGAMEYEYNLDTIISRMPHKRIGYKAYCSCCKKEMHMLMDYQFVFAGRPAWRESAICPSCHCNSRMRYMVERVLGNSLDENSSVYIYEQITNTYKALKKYFPKLQGSEYLGMDKVSGQIYDGIMHQDAMNLSFESESMDVVISNDVFEHVADYTKAFSEAYRVLKKDGKLIFTVPLYKTRQETETCARITSDGQIEHLKEPSYHGDPLSNNGCLVFYEYSWDILHFLKDAGFEDAYFVVYFSAKKAYFGYLPVIIEAIK